MIYAQRGKDRSLVKIGWESVRYCKMPCERTKTMIEIDI